jgi:PBP1b-binding outer membrane lipoprotein LpoB
MEKEEFMELQHSESVVAQMSATIFAALVQKQDFGSANEDTLVEKSVAIAIKLANRAEKLIKSDEEWNKKTTGSAFLGG